MRVLFLTLYPDSAASPRYRVTQFVPFLKSRGINCVVESVLNDEEYAQALDGRMGPARYHAKETLRRLIQIMNGYDYDIVVLQKAVMTAYLKGFDKLLRKKAKRLVVDIDDAVHLHPPVSLGMPWKWLEDRQQVATLLGSADLVLAGNHWLVEETTRLRGKAEYFPTVVDTNHYVPKEVETESFRIGWIGNPSTSGQLSVVKSSLESIKGAQTIIVGADRSTIDIDRAKYYPWSKVDELKQIQSFSVGLMPLEKTEWARGKCALKALLYMACGVPCVATPYGPITDIIEHNVNGLLVDSSEEWLAALEQLRDSRERKRLGQAGRKTVESEFSLEGLAPRYADLLESLV